MNDVFISYKSNEFDKANWVRTTLENNGISCWMAPMSIPGGSSYAEEIPIAIRQANVFVLILSSESQASKWVARELDLAINLGKTIMPFVIENCALKDDFNFYLTNVQRYSAYENKAEAIGKMIKEIKSLRHNRNTVIEDYKRDILASKVCYNMKLCRKCGCLNPTNSSFCNNCGSKVSEILEINTDKFIDNILTDISKGKLEPDMKVAMFQEMKLSLFDRIHEACISQLTDEKLDELELMLDEPDTTRERVSEFMQTAGVNIVQATIDGMTRLHEIWYGKDNDDTVQQNTSDPKLKNHMVDKQGDFSSKNDFVFAIEDTYKLSEEGSLILGRVVRGELNLGDTVDIVLNNGEIITSVPIIFHIINKETNESSNVNKIKNGENAAITFKDVKISNIVDIQAIVYHGINLKNTKFKANIKIYEKFGKPIFNYYSPMFVLLSSCAKNEVRGTIKFVDENIEFLKPNDTADVIITLESPHILFEGAFFGFFEGGRFAGSGNVISFVENDVQTVKEEKSEPSQVRPVSIPEFLENLLVEKGLTNLGNQTKANMINEMQTLLLDQINKAAIMKLREQQVDELNSLIESEQFTNEKMTEFMVNSGVNLTEVALDTMLKFREFYLGGN